MKYLIVGSGGTGGAIGAYLAKNNKDVTFIARGKHLEAMRKYGFKVNSQRVGDFVIKNPKACTMDEYNDSPDVIFVCVKYYSIQESIEFINKVANKNTLVIPILNVFGTGAVIQEACKQCTVLDGCMYIISMIQKPGVINQPIPIFKVYFGFRKGQNDELRCVAEKVEKDLNDSEIEAYLTEDIYGEAIKKFSYVSPAGAAGLYYNCTAGEFKAAGKIQNLFKNLIKEVQAIGNAMGIEFEEDLVKVNMDILEGVSDNSTTSMQRDVARGGESEFDGLVHRVVRLGEEYNVDVPNYRMISEWGKENYIK